MDEPEATLRGQLLLSSPAMFDPNFRRTVVLVTEHSPEGAMGVVLNRPSSVSVADAVPNLALLAGADALVHVGGPVQPEAVVALAELDDPSEAAAVAFGSVGYLRADVDPASFEGGVRRIRVFAGYSGWAAGQLDGEMEEGAWIVEEATADDVFCAVPEELWATVLTRKGGRYRLLATMPADPTAN